MTPEQLITRRNTLGLSQAKLAARLGVAPTTIYRWETKHTPIPAMVDLALGMLESAARTTTLETILRDLARETWTINDGASDWAPDDLRAQLDSEALDRPAQCVVNGNTGWIAYYDERGYIKYPPIYLIRQH